MLLAVAHASGASGRAENVDWKYYGGAPIYGDLSRCFYDEKGLAREPNSHMRVWIKCLSQKEIDHFDIQKELGGKVIEAIAKKVAKYYLPPIAILDNYSVDQIVQTTASETIADLSYIQARARIFYEIDCDKKMLQQLSIDFAGRGRDNKVGDWQYVPPEECCYIVEAYLSALIAIRHCSKFGRGSRKQGSRPWPEKGGGGTEWRHTGDSGETPGRQTEDKVATVPYTNAPKVH
jgi:hypothetical protein